MLKKYIVLPAVLAILNTGLSYADNLPPLPSAQEITEGTLSNGIKYYLVDNPHTYEHADFAVVQKSFSDPGSASHNLVSLPHFGSRRPCDYLSDHGAGYPAEGFVSCRGGNTRYCFPSISIGTQAVCDSTILLLLDIASTCPGEQALIISGDIDIPKIKERLSLLSLTISSREKSSGIKPYEWMPRTEPSVYYSGSPCESVSSLRVTYSSARTPEDRMNTSQPLVIRQYSMYLGFILGKRIRSAFRDAGIPLADMQYRYRDSAGSPGDELYTLTVSTSSARLRDAVGTVAAVLSGIDTEGSSSGEFEEAKSALVMAASRDGGNRRLSDQEYVTLCTDAFLYGASLASEATVNDIFVRSSLPVSAELPIFNSFVSALLDSKSNLILGFETPAATAMPELETYFSVFWQDVASGKIAAPVVPSRSGRFDLSSPRNKSKVEVRQPDALTGGSSLVLSNGLKIICRKTDLKGEVRYAFHMKGGSSLASGISRGESAFLTDMFNLCEVSGMSGEDFRAALTSEGVTFCPEVTPSEIIVSGRAPKDKIPVVMKALEMLSGTLSIPQADYDYYRSCEELKLCMERGGGGRTRDIVDSLLDVGKRLRPGRSRNFLSVDLPRKSQAFFTAQFARFTSGVLSLMGDVDMETVEKNACMFLGGISPSSEAVRSRVAAFSPYGKDAMYGGASVGSSSHMAWLFQGDPNDSGRMAVRMASIALQENLRKVLAALGYSFTLEMDTIFYPQEMVKILLDCSPCPRSGLPEGVTVATPEAVTDAVEKLVSDLSSRQMDLAVLKTFLAHEIEMEASDTDYLTRAVILRNSLGRDILTGAERSARSVTREQVQSVFKKMESGRHVNYIIP